MLYVYGCMLRVNQAFDNSAKEAVDLFSKIIRKLIIIVRVAEVVVVVAVIIII